MALNLQTHHLVTAELLAQESHHLGEALTLIYLHNREHTPTCSEVIANQSAAAQGNGGRRDRLTLTFGCFRIGASPTGLNRMMTAVGQQQLQPNTIMQRRRSLTGQEPRNCTLLTFARRRLLRL